MGQVGTFTYYKIYSRKSHHTPSFEILHEEAVSKKAAEENLQYAIDNGFLTQAQADKYGEIIMSNILRDAYAKGWCIFAGDYMLIVGHKNHDKLTPEQLTNMIDDEYGWSLIQMEYYKVGKGQVIQTKEEANEYDREQMELCLKQIEELKQQKQALYRECFGQSKPVMDINRMLKGI
jgi:hypothetical protein